MLTSIPSWWQSYGQLVTQYAQEYGVDPSLVAAVIEQESGGNPNAQSSEGANGLMQVVGGSLDPASNIQQGVSILAHDIDTFGITLGLAAYNAGPGNVQTYGNNILNPSYLISQGWSAFDANQPATYVANVPALWQQFTSLFGGTSSAPPVTAPVSSGATGALPQITTTTGKVSTATVPQELAAIWQAMPSLSFDLANPLGSIGTIVGQVFQYALSFVWILIGLLIAIVGLWLLVRSQQ